jgi:LysR family transcriptional regulator, cys regulon transcriptional activator
MNLTQLRYVSEIVRRGLNLSAVAEALYTSQPGISKQIRGLEQEIGTEIFVRRGKRLVSLTEPGKRILAIAQRILAEAENLRRAGEDFANEHSGTLTIAATHTQARYALPRAVAAFKRRYPTVQLVIHQGTPTQSCEQVLSGEADFAISTEMTTLYPDLVSLPCYQWNRCIVVPPGHALLRAKPLTLEAIAEYPIVTYDFSIGGRSLVNKAFEARGLRTNVVLTALDADVIKTYVELELGVGIMAQMAFNPMRDRALRALDASQLFEPSTTRLGIKRGAYLRAYAFEFIALFAPHLVRATVEKALAGHTAEPRELPAQKRVSSK